jgi:hypothetical protein
MSDIIAKLLNDAFNTPELPDWYPEKRGTCACGHSWMFHWLDAPHKCNDCAREGRECAGYVCEREV